MIDNIKNYEACDALQFVQGSIRRKGTKEELTMERYLIAFTLIPPVYKERHDYEWAFFCNLPGYTKRLVTNFYAEILEAIAEAGPADKIDLEKNLQIIFCEDDSVYKVIIHENKTYSIIKNDVTKEELLEAIKDSDCKDEVVCEAFKKIVSLVSDDVDVQLETHSDNNSGVDNRQDAVIDKKISIVENGLKDESMVEELIVNADNKDVSACEVDLGEDKLCESETDLGLIQTLSVIGEEVSSCFDENEISNKKMKIYDIERSMLHSLCVPRSLGEIFGGPSTSFCLLGGGSGSEDEDWGLDEREIYYNGFDVYNFDDYDRWKEKYDYMSPFDEEYQPIIIHQSNKIDLRERDKYKSDCLGFSFSSNPYNYLLQKGGEANVFGLFDPIYKDNQTLCVSAIAFDMLIRNDSNGSIDFVAFPSSSRFNFDDLTSEIYKEIVKKYDLEVHHLDPGFTFRLENCDVDLDFFYLYEEDDEKVYWDHEDPDPWFYYLNVLVIPPGSGVKRLLTIDCDFRFELVPSG